MKLNHYKIEYQKEIHKLFNITFFLKGNNPYKYSIHIEFKWFRNANLYEVLI